MPKGVKTDGGLTVIAKPNLHHPETLAYAGHKHVANENPVSPGSAGFHPVAGSPGKVKPSTGNVTGDRVDTEGTESAGGSEGKLALEDTPGDDGPK